MKKQQEFAYNSALKNIQKIGNITEIPSLQVAFSEEELNALDWFFDQLDTEQLRQYDSLNTGETIDVNSVLITARLGNKEVGIRIGFAMNLLDITIFHKDRFSSEFEKNFSLLRHAFRDDPIPENKISNIVIDELYNARKKSNNNVIKQGRIEYINNDLGITDLSPIKWTHLSANNYLYRIISWALPTPALVGGQPAMLTCRAINRVSRCEPSRVKLCPALPALDCHRQLRTDFLENNVA